MRRTLLSAGTAALVAALGAPAAAGASVLDVYQGLAERNLHPAPLVPVTAPPRLQPLDRTLEGGGSRRGSGYGVRIVHRTSSGPDAVINLEGGSFRNAKALLRDARRLGFHTSRTRVRGHRGYLFKRSRERELAWIEDGRIYTIATGTPKKVSLRQLRATAARLDRLEGFFLGASQDPNKQSEGFVAITEHTISADVDWTADCNLPSGDVGAQHAGRATDVLLPRRGDSFGFDIAQHLRDSEPWAGSVSGTISQRSVDLSLRATATLDGFACDSGQQSFSLERTSG